MATDWRWCWTPKRLKVHLPIFTTGFVLPSIKIVYYQHLLVSFEGLLSLRLSDHFALVVGCIMINNNWLNLWKKYAYKVFTGISPPLLRLSANFPSQATGLQLSAFVWEKMTQLRHQATSIWTWADVQVTLIWTLEERNSNLWKRST